MRASHWNLRLQPKLLLGLVIMAAVLVSALTPAISQLYRGHMERHYSNPAFEPGLHCGPAHCTETASTATTARA